MSQFEKLIARIKNLDKKMRLEEIVKVLEYRGYQGFCPHGGSSHITFRKDGYRPTTIPNNRPIKVINVKMVKEMIADRSNE